MNFTHPGPTKVIYNITNFKRGEVQAFGRILLNDYDRDIPVMREIFKNVRKLS